MDPFTLMLMQAFGGGGQQALTGLDKAGAGLNMGGQVADFANSIIQSGKNRGLQEKMHRDKIDTALRGQDLQRGAAAQNNITRLIQLMLQGGLRG